MRVIRNAVPTVVGCNRPPGINVVFIHSIVFIGITCNMKYDTCITRNLKKLYEILNINVKGYVPTSKLSLIDKVIKKWFYMQSHLFVYSDHSIKLLILYTDQDYFCICLISLYPLSFWYDSILVLLSRIYIAHWLICLILQ